MPGASLALPVNGPVPQRSLSALCLPQRLPAFFIRCSTLGSVRAQRLRRIGQTSTRVPPVAPDVARHQRGNADVVAISTSASHDVTLCGPARIASACGHMPPKRPTRPASAADSASSGQSGSCISACGQTLDTAGVNPSPSCPRCLSYLNRRTTGSDSRRHPRRSGMASAQRRLSTSARTRPTPVPVITGDSTLTGIPNSLPFLQRRGSRRAVSCLARAKRDGCLDQRLVVGVLIGR